MSRPRADRLELVERVAHVLQEDPDTTANTVCRVVGGRRRDVLRVVRAIRAAQRLGDGAPGAPRRFPNRESGNS